MIIMPLRVMPKQSDIRRTARRWRWHGLMLQKSGRLAEARNAYKRYLAMAPNAPDAPFIRQQLQQ
jgi:predicted RNA polymerase sigma factor